MTGPNEEKAEEDVGEDDHVAGSREGKDEYVGRTFSDDSIDAGETGAEARSND